jgi:thiopurine S-methyltransferase
MAEDWLDRWENGRTGWHEAGGNSGLRAHWQGNGGRVLVPLCGKTPDLVWLAERGHEVTGVELAEKAIREFFAEQSLSYVSCDSGHFAAFTCNELPITIWCGDYFAFTADPFDALYDRGAIVAVDPDDRPRYVEHTKTLLKPDSAGLIVTLEYDQQVVQGPPWALPAKELETYWDNLERVEEQDDFETCPPKFRKAGLREIVEVVWRSSG